MLIAIPTRGRAGLVSGKGTLPLIPKSLIRDTVLFVHEDEFGLYQQEVDRLHYERAPRVVDFKYSRIGEKRHMIGSWAKSNGYGKFVMLDDDIDFLVRRDSDDWRLRAAEEDEVVEMFAMMERLLDTYALVGVSAREGNNRYGLGTPDELVVENTRIMRISAFRTEEFLSVQHGRVDVMEDFDVAIQLLRRGMPNALMAYWANGQRMTNAPGGCSIWRTLEVHNAAAHRLAELHPGLVTTRLKQNKTDADGLGTRTEVTVQWKKAYGHG